MSAMVDASDMPAYDELILTHARDPRRTALGRPASVEHTGENRLCGDSVRIMAARDDKRLELACIAAGCAICRASGSMLMELAAETPTADLPDVIADFCAAFKSPVMPSTEGASGVFRKMPDAPSVLGMTALLALRRFPARTRCVLLPWETLAGLLSAEYRDEHDHP
jgi:NifU-like protein involved in Fe-S cluster formation